ncbi:NADPH-dependent FMN reductase [Paenibacillus nasutitermitis]|uniref:FMN reductase n=1 Tax=Paenibacillus nasutitermitis TaxID=1652958 RepID=A0A917DX87_9BACL|nr:NAD(P)H-dependent oxidoreductase [Paenibacillus nasutitermitis]GGD77467.1 FMN reductase [Paenibacillus nasutitermitis]
MKVVIIAGSNRKDATSTRLAEHVEDLIRQRGHKVLLFSLYRSPLPFYSPVNSFQDHEGLSELKLAMLEADAVVLASPEYHGSISGVLKNALDHLGQDHFSGKPVLSISSSGGTVGISSLQQLQSIVRNLHGINSPEWLSIGGAQRKWFEMEQGNYEGGQDIDDRIHRVLGAFLQLAQQVRGG